MAIIFNCSCGKKLKVRDELAGKKVKCPGCGKAAIVSPPKQEEELDLLPLEEKPISPSPSEPEKDGSKSPPRPKAPSTGKRCPNQKCSAPIAPGDVICHSCGAQVGTLKGRTEKKFSFYQHPLFKFLIKLLVLGAIGLVVYINFFKPKPEKDGESKDPVVLLRKELNDTESSSLKSLSKTLATASDNALDVLSEEYQKGGKLTKRVKITQALVILAYHGKFNKKGFYLNLTEKIKTKHPSVKNLLSELFYLISTSNPDYSLIENHKKIDKHNNLFRNKDKNILVKDAKNYLAKFARDKNELVQIKALSFLINLGETNRLEQLAKFIESKDSDIRTKTTGLLSHFTGRHFNNKAKWDAWWNTNKSVSPDKWGTQPEENNQEKEEEPK